MQTTSFEDFWCPLGERELGPGVPAISGGDWVALLKIANGDWNVPAEELACLLERRLIEITAGIARITQTGYIALGMPV